MCAFGASLAATLSAESPKVSFPAPSPAATLKQRVGLTDIEITYSRPGVKGRQVFGGLLPYGQVWRTGANAATKITFSTSVNFGGTQVPAGAYALFSIPDEKQWTVILNKVTGQWGAYTYDAANDAARVNVAPFHLSDPVETFTIDVNDIRDESATLNLAWQNTRVAVPLRFDVVSRLVPQLESALAPANRPAAGLYDRAAMFYLENNLDLKQAAAWINAAIERQPNSYPLYYHKAQILARQGDHGGAAAAARRSIDLAAGAKDAAGEEYTRLNQTLIASLGQ